jgi:hypothetical protein
MGELNIFDLSGYIDKYGLSVFVETGTLHGAGIDHAKKYRFEKIYSIEIDDDLYERAANKYADDDRVEILHGSSHEKIKELVSIDANIFFWLDAHFPSADCGKKKYLDEQNLEKRSPLVTEINEIKIRCGAYNDVILADDLWLYNEHYKHLIGDINSHMKSLGQNVTRKELVGDTDDSFFYDAFQNTHNIDIIKVSQGYVLITPKDN